jgi:uncharacterized membrane protein YkoI
MKNLFLMAGAIALLGLAACGQTSKDVPAKVKAAFTQKFPAATNIKWDNENDSEWEAEFKLNGTEYSANFDNTGAWMETEYEISSSDIPITVKTTLEKEYAAYKIEASEISETSNGKVYEFELKNGKVEIEVTFDTKGNIMKKEQIEKEGEKDNN